jgi:ABC-2 type transport system ATP-binding protein
MVPMTIATVDHLTKIFEKGGPKALDDINAIFAKGKIVGLVGPDGAGKTTLIRFLAALLAPTTGHVIVDGFDTMLDPKMIQKMIGYMPQKFGLYEDLTVEQNLNLYADLHGVKKEERKQIFDQLLHFTTLEPFKKRFAGRLSGGMKQKLGLACTLIRRPKFLLLDEPSVGVDPISRKELWKMVKELLEQDVSVVWSTSYIDEAERCDEVILLNQGKILYAGIPSKLTETLKDRTFKLTEIEGNRRKVLMKALLMPEVEDGTIQGDAVRLLMRKPNEIISLPSVGKVENTPPKFEDAFIDILGGGPGGESKLAEVFVPIEAKSEDVIIADHLTKKFGSFIAADDISFKVKTGEIFGLLGPNGAGKSTTFKMMCGLLTPTSGEASVYGYHLGSAPQVARSKIGYMAQKFSLYGTLSVLQNLNFFSGIYGLKGSHKKEMIQKMIDIFNLEPYLNVSTDLLPLGFKQRVALACAVVHNPPVLFLDEPTSGVDPITRREFWNHINGLVDKGVTVMVTTHFMDEAEYCDRIGLIYKGKMIKLGTPDELKEVAITKENQTPTLEDAFITLIEGYDLNDQKNSSSR